MSTRGPDDMLSENIWTSWSNRSQIGDLANMMLCWSSYNGGLGGYPPPPLFGQYFWHKTFDGMGYPRGVGPPFTDKICKTVFESIEKTIDLMTMRSSKLTWKHSDKEDYYSWTTLPKRHPKVNDSMWKSTRMKKPTRLLKQIPCRTQRYERSSLPYMTKLFSCHPPLPASDLSMKWFWWSCF